MPALGRPKVRGFHRSVRVVRSVVVLWLDSSEEVRLNKHASDGLAREALLDMSADGRPVHLSISPTEPAPSGSTGTSRPCRRCFPPSPASPRSGCLPSQPACYDRPETTVFHRRKVNQRL